MSRILGAEKEYWVEVCSVNGQKELRIQVTDWVPDNQDEPIIYWKFTLNSFGL